MHLRGGTQRLRQRRNRGRHFTAQFLEHVFDEQRHAALVFNHQRAQTGKLSHSAPVLAAEWSAGSTSRVGSKDEIKLSAEIALDASFDKPRAKASAALAPAPGGPPRSCQTSSSMYGQCTSRTCQTSESISLRQMTDAPYFAALVANSFNAIVRLRAARGFSGHGGP